MCWVTLLLVAGPLIYVFGQATATPTDLKLQQMRFSDRLRVNIEATPETLDANELYPHFNGEHLVILHDGTELKLSRSRKDCLEHWLGTDAV